MFRALVEFAYIGECLQERLTVSTSERYRSAATTLYDQAEIELAAGDLRQASEKFWGAAAQAMKSVASRHGWEHKSHAHAYGVINNLTRLTGDRRIRDWFGHADLLHTNFYEDWMDEADIRKHSQDVRRLIDRLDEID